MMKKLALPSKKSITIKALVYLTFLLTAMLQSCGTEERLEGSLDGNRQSYSGPSYPSSSDNDLRPGGNLGILVIGGLGGSPQSNGYNNRHTNFSNSLYANADQDLGQFLQAN